MAVTRRNSALDVLRGLTLCLGVLVANQNWQQPGFTDLQISTGNGLQLADLVAPFFIVLMGASIPLSVSSMRRHGKSSSDIFQRAAFRFVKLLALGLLVNLLWDWNWYTFRIPGLMVRIAVVYFACASLYIFLKPKWWILYILVGSGLLYFLEHGIVPPNGLSVYAFLDSVVLHKHVLPQTAPIDPEGLLSTVAAVFSGIAGLWAGQILNSGSKKSMALLGLGLLLFGETIHFTLFPSNRMFWSPSFVFISAGICLLVLWVLWYFSENRIWKAAFQWAEDAGQNAFLLFAFAELSLHIWTGHFFPVPVREKVIQAFFSGYGVDVQYLLWGFIPIALTLVLGKILMAKNVSVRL